GTFTISTDVQQVGCRGIRQLANNRPIFWMVVRGRSQPTGGHQRGGPRITEIGVRLRGTGDDLHVPEEAKLLVNELLAWSQVIELLCGGAHP
ncbi:hypothetical protein DKP78_18750, partial [Enterococcus faecium]